VAAATFYGLADRLNLKVGETFERAVEALAREADRTSNGWLLHLQPAVLDPGLGTDAAAAGEAAMTDAQRRVGLWLGIWLIAAILVLLVTSVVGIIPLVRIVRGLLSWNAPSHWLSAQRPWPAQQYPQPQPIGAAGDGAITAATMAVIMAAITVDGMVVTVTAGVDLALAMDSALVS
jgi:hypothetical protein